MQMKSMNSTILLILISAGAISLALALNEIPAIWSFILPWLRPPYLLIVINGIIIAIIAASRFRWSQPAPPVPLPHLIYVKTPSPAYSAAYSSPPEVREVAEVPEAAAAVYESEDIDRVVELKPVMVNGLEVGADAEEAGEEALGGSTLMYNPPSPERFSPEFQLEYFTPADQTGNIPERESTWKKTREVASRAADEEVRRGGAGRPAPDRHRYNTRKSKSFKERSIYHDSPPSHAKASTSLNQRVDAFMDRSSAYYSPPAEIPTGNIPPRGVREAEEEYETMESAWKKISEGASRAAVGEEVCYVGPPLASLRKSSSFKERAIYNDPPMSSGIRKEASPSQDELNQRVEAFIKKVNVEIRLRRQNSSNQYIQLNSAA